MDWVLLLSRLCIGVTIASNAGGIPVAMDIVRKGSTHPAPFLPFLAGFVCNAACVSFAMVRADGVLLITGGVGITMSTFYVTVYLFFSSDTNTTLKQLLASAVAIFGYYFYLTRFVREPSAVEGQLGLLSGILITGMNIAPLADIGDIIQKKSSAGLSLSMAVAIFVTSILWVLYGAVLGEPVIAVPSVSGVLSGLVMFYLLWTYPAAKNKTVKAG